MVVMLAALAEVLSVGCDDDDDGGGCVGGVAARTFTMDTDTPKPTCKS